MAMQRSLFPCSAVPRETFTGEIQHGSPLPGAVAGQGFVCSCPDGDWGLASVWGLCLGFAGVSHRSAQGWLDSPLSVFSTCSEEKLTLGWFILIATTLNAASILAWFCLGYLLHWIRYLFLQLTWLCPCKSWQEGTTQRSELPSRDIWDEGGEKDACGGYRTVAGGCIVGIWVYPSQISANSVSQHCSLGQEDKF